MMNHEHGPIVVTDPSNWKPCKRPPLTGMRGSCIDVVPWSRSHHGEALWESFGGTQTNELLYHFGWPQMRQWENLADQLDEFNESGAFITCIFADKVSHRALGMASYMNIVPEHGRIETGAIAHGADLQRSRAATEGHYLMACRVFDELGYRRYEWKLNNPNKASHAAARRFGFTFEGVFRQHQVMAYGNRDTAWYSMLDSEWPRCKAAFQAWLSDDNFDGDGRQKMRLEDIRLEL